MSTDAAGVPSESASLVSAGLDAAAGAVATAFARHVRTLDDRLTLLAVRMFVVALSFLFACFYFALMYLQLINEHGQWLPPGVNHPATFIGVAELALILIAAAVYYSGQWLGLYRRDFGRLQLALWGAAPVPSTHLTLPTNPRG